MARAIILSDYSLNSRERAVPETWSGAPQVDLLVYTISHRQRYAELFRLEVFGLES
jgi:hypothetical protein